MAPPAPTIPTLKQNFLTTQTRLLSQPLQPSRTWRRANDSAGDATRVPERAVDDALFRLNHTLQQHARRVYAPQATRHVAEQIDRLYLSVGERSGDGGDDAEGEEGWRAVGADYADAGVIASLPPAWESEREVEAYPLEAKRYAELVARLQDLSARRQQAEERVRRLRRMRGLLAPFEMDGEKAGADAATNGVQENLVTRDGEVEKELERMRMLLVRVGDKVSRLKGRVGEDEEDEDLFGDGDAMIVDDVEVEERRKVEGLLDGLV
ncbi:Kinetochore protein fta4 [Cytospora mali]|uniref:Kinetochore protein fta4 n=1 Tax=Cytospora mali TaxID=578113 RepID=A0A194WDD4_CYTMA|nr:Kinetochore protein fta4 [Valsa mali]